MKVSRVLFISFFIGVTFLTGCKKTSEELIKSGVSLELAKLREKQIKDLKYKLSFNVPGTLEDKVLGNEVIEFSFSNIKNKPLIIDFRNPEEYIKSIKINDKKIRINFENEHIVIPSNKLKEGKNSIEIDFIAGERALNRNEEYLYTLFVPDRACTAFPCFDQPSLKAVFQPEITVPKAWTAVANTGLVNLKENDNKTQTFAFEESNLISTYLFSFVAGKFDSVTKEYPGDFSITLYHREKDSIKVNRNLEKIFELKYSSLKWLEEYTRIDYPFKKLDFIAIPSFQYSGMEHPGAVLYRDSKLFLEENSTIRDELNRANLIAHETAHMWFGDLVTMKWFSEVWLKEVFANFMAGKIVNPQYPEINHDLNFLINHYPASYSIDRTRGANAIEQELDNMKNAGTLYGAIIYHKAPIMMNHLENITGKELLKEGLHEYLANFAYGNANWSDLIDILDSKTNTSLREWSNTWVFKPGMPHFNVQKAYDVQNDLQSVIFEQTDPSGNGKQWEQKLKVLIKEGKKEASYSIVSKDTFNVVVVDKKKFKSPCIYPNSNGLAYGYFELDSLSKFKILSTISKADNPLLRCSMYISLWENMLQGNVAPKELLEGFINSIKHEENPQNINLITEYTTSLYWRFLNQEERNHYSRIIENVLWNKILANHKPGEKRSFFKAFRSMALSNDAVDRLYQLWTKEISVPGLNLSVNDYNKIVFELAIRDYENIEDILDKQFKSLEDTEKKNSFSFIRPALSNNTESRRLFFESLKDEKNREKEPWVIDALEYFHHPLKSEQSVVYIKPSLEILEELQVTGDIFFPKRWLDATFKGHSSINAVTEINLFLNENPEFPENLKNKILQSTDLVFRSIIIKKD